MYNPRFIFKKYKNNEIISISKITDLSYFVEVVYYCENYEIFIRPKSKKYGYFIVKFDDLNKALNYSKVIDDNFIKDFLKSYNDIF